jgi:AAHS family 4-hydroxybenzoate transporter-like MFS transporter
VPAVRQVVDVGKAIDEGRWGGYQQWLVFLTALTIIFDGIDNQLLGITIPAIMRDWNVGRGVFAPIVALGFVGMMIGGAVAGLAGDRFGRRVALLGSVILFALATLAVAVVATPGQLGALRLIAGIGLGGAIPNGASLAAEYVPLRQRPLAVTLTIVCVPLGATLAGLVSLQLLPSVGWRALFGLGGVVPMIAALLLFRVLPESPRFLARRPDRWPELRQLLTRMGHRVDPDATFATSADAPVAQAPLSSVFNHDYRGDTAALWCAFVSCLFAVYLGFTWLPSILTSAGLGPSVANTGITVFNLGGVVGAITGGILIKRFGSRVTMLTMAAAAIAGAAVLSRVPLTASSVPAIIALLTITGGLINAVQTTMYALAAHVYPTPMRATGVGASVAFGRLGAIASGYAGPSVLESGGSAAFFALMAAAMVAALLGLAMVGRHVPRRT